MNKFIIPIPNEKAATYRIINLIIPVLNFLVFGTLFLQSGTKSLDFACIAGMVVNGIPAVYFLLNKRHFGAPYLQAFFLGDALLWLIAGSYSLAALMVVLAFFSFLANRPLNIIFDENGIKYPSFPIKNYEWREVENVVWKDDILTIDLKSNKLMQFTINTYDIRPVNVDAFNEAVKNFIQRSPAA